MNIELFILFEEEQLKVKTLCLQEGLDTGGKKSESVTFML